MSRLTDDELFKELNRTERPVQAREETLEKLQRRIGQKRRHVFPFFLSGILAAGAIIFLAFLLFDSSLQQTMKQGEVTEGVEQRIFEGSSGEWSVEYEMTEGEQKESVRYVLAYRGFEFPERVNYEIRLPDGSVESGSDVPLEAGKIIKGTATETCECDLAFGEEQIEVSISWNGTTEVFDLGEKLLIPLPLFGAGESWSFTLEPGAFGEKDKIVLTYIGEGQAPEVIDYEFVGVLGGTSGTNYTLDEGQLVQQGEMQNFEIYREDQEIEIIVNWEGQTESFNASPNEE